MPQIFKQLSESNSKELSNCVLSHCHKDSFTLWHTHTVPVSGDLHVHLQHHCLFWLHEFSCFHMPSVRGVVAPGFCVSRQSTGPFTTEKPLQVHIYPPKMCMPAFCTLYCCYTSWSRKLTMSYRNPGCSARHRQRS